MGKLTIVVTGAQGQLGMELVEWLRKMGHFVYGFGKAELDVTNEILVHKVLQDLKPDVVIHTAAYTKVDQAEHEPEEANRINGGGTAIIAAASESIGARLVYISTDYVFNGQAIAPYSELSAVDPINAYGRSKLLGEQFVESLHTRYFIVRTSWVYGAGGNNFVKTMLKLGAEQRPVSVVNDQVGCPTYTRDLTACIAELIATDKYGVYHVSNSGYCSWYEFAQKIFELTDMKVDLKMVTSEQFVRPAARPSYSVFDHTALKQGGFSAMEHWETALDRFLTEYHYK